MTVVLSEPVELGHVRHPTNDSERLLFRQLAETLVRLDCEGKVRPRLADSWEADSVPGWWTFTLAEDARLAGGNSVSPLVVASALRSPDARALGIDSAIELDRRRVRVHLRSSSDTAPRILADPASAILDSVASSSKAGSFQIPRRDGRPAIEFQLAGNGDPRDALDRGADIAVTRDLAVSDYAAGRSGLVSFALPWSRTYVLLQPATAGPIDALGTDSFRRTLARDAVRSEARPAEGPFWFDSVQSCPMHSSAPAQATALPRVVYPREDEAARGLAERVVALAGDPKLTAAPLSGSDFETALRQGSEWAYIVPLPRQTLDPCREAAGWLPGATIQPLIDTRARAIVRRPIPDLSVDWDGTVRLEPRRGPP